jgi:hypothetical protein
MPDTDLAAIIESAVTDICNDARLSAKGQHGDYYRCIVSQAIAAALAAHRQQVAAMHQGSSITDDELNKIEYDLSFDRVSFDLLDLVGQMRRERQQVAALAAATLCGTVAFRGDDGSGESIVAIRFDCRTEADEFVKLLESLGDRQ